MKKKVIAIIVALFVATQVFAVGFTNVPTSGKEIVIMKGGTVVWHATDWKLSIDTCKYTDMKLFQSGGDDYFKIYTFTGTPVKNIEGGTKSWSSFSVIDCEDLTWFFK